MAGECRTTSTIEETIEPMAKAAAEKDDGEGQGTRPLGGTTLHAILIPELVTIGKKAAHKLKAEFRHKREALGHRHGWWIERA
ncbi:hypothetical protein E2562_021297 [Oryza meyeriana var. granulata]|uniref:Uncharacterized protein n=1 Tax=Oryza meyeriana var. granulata TaxID=110450 RepID=A0A6G1BXD7_9ORYZ|nr:hypothetical protein E2562_021297 [Oryza meyeriana var. granulata]